MQYSPKNEIPYVAWWMPEQSNWFARRGQKSSVPRTSSRIRSRLVAGAARIASLCRKQCGCMSRKHFNSPHAAFAKIGANRARPQGMDPPAIRSVGLMTEEVPTLPSTPTPAIRTTARRRNAHANQGGRPPPSRCLGEAQHARQRLLRHYVGRYVGTKPPEKIAKVFRTGRDARDKAVELILTTSRKVNRCKAGKWTKQREASSKKPATEIFFPSHGHNIAHPFTATAPTWTESNSRRAPLDSWHLHFRRPGIYLPSLAFAAK